MKHYERIDPEDPSILSLTRLGHYERYYLAQRLLNSEDVVLDAACGLGYGAEIIAKKAGYVVALDKDNKTIEMCKDKYGHIPNLEFKIANIEDIPYKNNSFDTVVGIECIEHIDYPEQFLQEANRVLKPKGKLMISTPYGNNTLFPDGKPFSQFHLREYTFAEMMQLLDNAGFDFVDNFGQYILFGSLMKLTSSHIKPTSNIEGGKVQTFLERIPFIATIFSRHYKFIRRTSKNMFYLGEKR